MVNWVNADAIITDVNDRLLIFQPGLPDLDVRLWLSFGEFGGIINKVLKYFKQALMVAINRRQVPVQAAGQSGKGFRSHRPTTRCGTRCRRRSGKFR